MRKVSRPRVGNLTLNLLTAAGLIGLTAAVSLTAPRWARFLAQPLPVAEHELTAEEELLEPEPAGAAPVERRINVNLFLEDVEAGGLVIEERAVPLSSSLSRQLEIVVAEVLQGSETGLLSPLPAQTRVLHVFMRDGVAYVNLSAEAQEEPPAGSRSELLSVFALVNTITANFPAVRRVQILVDDRQAETLSGHVDLSRPLYPDMSLLAAAELTPIHPTAPDG